MNNRSEITDTENSDGLVNEGTGVNPVGSVNEGTSKNSVCMVNEGTSENSRNSLDQDVKETVIVIRSDEECENGDTFKNPGKVVEEEKVKEKDLEDDKYSCVIDVKNGGTTSGSAGGGEEFERVCRICQLIPEVLEKGNRTGIKDKDLIQLGCGCKEGMSIVHSHCAETWFKLKGNRVCEICGEAAKNIAEIREQRLLEEWDEVRLNGILGSEASEGCWQKGPFCNFMMACLVLAFFLPWFLHVTWPF